METAPRLEPFIARPADEQELTWPRPEPEEANRVIRAIGLWNGYAYVLNIDTGLWHGFAGVRDELIACDCGERGREVDDDTAARVLASKGLGLCVGCFAFGLPTVRLEPPERIRRLLGEAL